MSLVERVARAIHRAEYPDGSYEGFVAHTPDPQKYMRQARAAIEAMPIKEAARKITIAISRERFATTGKPRTLEEWEKFICTAFRDAALAEGGEG